MLRVPDGGALMPEELATADFQKGFGAPGSLKSHEWLLLAGPLGKYALQGCIQGREARVVFAYLDFLGALWAKVFRRDHVEALISQGRRLLAQLELLFPAWELDINRHMMQHLLNGIMEWGPPWTWSAFGYERLWGRMCEWLLNKAWPEASIMLGMRALQTSLQYLSRLPCYQATTDDMPDRVSLYYALISFDRATNALLLPGYLKSSSATAVRLWDDAGIHSVKPYPGYQVGAKFLGAWQELHNLYQRWPELCKPCGCEGEECSCRTYRQLWVQYLGDMGVPAAQLHLLSKDRTGELLLGWRDWAEAQGATEHEQMLCFGPDSEVRMFDRATFGPVQLVDSRLEQHVRAKNSIVVFEKPDGRGYEVGRVRRFFRHLSPGYIREDGVGDVNIADVDWYANAVKSRPANAVLDSAGMDKLTGLPVVKRSHIDDKMGNYWQCDQLVQSKFGLAPHPVRMGDMVLLSRSSDLQKH